MMPRSARDPISSGEIATCRCDGAISEDEIAAWRLGDDWKGAGDGDGAPATAPPSPPPQSPAADRRAEAVPSSPPADRPIAPTPDTVSLAPGLPRRQLERETFLIWQVTLERLSSRFGAKTMVDEANGEEGGDGDEP